MNDTATIVAIVTVIGCLVLATRSSALRNAGARHVVRLALIWVAIIFALMALVRLVGVRIAS
ncbi:hypothetical protein [Novosphingobium sp.]|uniref:hypothetical protein n=1 Tax=Novosphingobium sp. TaxID=1874826 RepID=UPI002B4A888C|nr:hypothetical protein [Novosphingobium sp.]HKR92396.1 hypothetical protein [Novosphingobium sp.]